MKCSFCGNNLENGAEFCPECGMIIGMDGITQDNGNEVEAEVPEYVPNVFRAMDFEEEPAEPARELEVTDNEETAIVVEQIAEYTQEPDVQDVLTKEEAVTETESFEVPEYDPTAEVSQTVEDAPVVAEQNENEAVAQEAEPEFAPPEYEGNIASVETADDKQEENIPVNEPDEPEEASENSETYPVYNDEENVAVPEEELTEDASILEAIIEDAEEENEKIEDITPVADKPSKGGGKNIVSIVLLVVALVGVVFAGGYVFKNVLPKIVDTDKTTSAPTQDVDATVKPEKTTAGDKETTTKETTTKTTEKDTTTTEPTTTEPTTTESTTKETTTEEPETTTEEPETTEATPESVILEPSVYNVDEVPFFPTNGDIGIMSAPSGDYMITHPYGYPVYAYASQDGYYYVHSPYLDYMGWVSAEDVYEYVEETTTAAAQQETYTDVSYVAVINSDDGLKFRTGPGTDYSVSLVVPGGFYVRVSAESTENPGWVYVTVEDSRYPYGSPSGWVLGEYLS